MSKSRRFVIEFVAQAALALAVGLSVSVALAGATLLLADGANPAGAEPRASSGTAEARP